MTELPGSEATPEQLVMLYARYRLASRVIAGRDVLEVACGPGVGLGHLARTARVVIGGDYDAALLHHARAHYADRLPLLRLDAHALPFAAGAFDVVILFEALYYLHSPERFVQEARRVLRPAGVLLVSTVNRDWPGFNPSPLSHRYLSGPELVALLGSQGFAVELFGGFAAQADTVLDRVLLAVRRLAVRLNLIPATMKGKARLKRLIYGRLVPLPAELNETATVDVPLVPLSGDGPISAYKVLYAVGRLR